METKICSKCNIEKNIDEFYIRTATGKPDKKCKKCVIEKQIEYDNSDRGRERSKQYCRSANGILRAAKSRAKKRGIEFNLLLEDIDIPEFCPVLGIKLEFNDDYQKDSSPSIDRINNQKGYIKNNIKIISYRANQLKSDLSIEEIEKIIKYIEKFEK